MGTELPDIAPLVQAWKQELMRDRSDWDRRRRRILFVILGNTVFALIFVLLALHLQSSPQPLGRPITHIHALPIKGGRPGSNSWRLAGWQSWQNTYQQAQRLLIIGISSVNVKRYRSLVGQLNRLPLSRYPVPPRILYLLQMQAYGHPVTPAARHYVLDWYHRKRLYGQLSYALWFFFILLMLSTIWLTLRLAITNHSLQKAREIYEQIDSEFEIL